MPEKPVDVLFMNGLRTFPTWPLLLCVCLFTIMLTYYCMDLATKGLWLLDRAKVFTVPPLLVQTISLGDKVLPPPSIRL